MSNIEWKAWTKEFMEQILVDPVGTIRDKVAHNLVVINELADNVPFGGRYDGHYGIIQYLGELARGIDMGPLEYEEMFCDGNTVVGIGREKSVARSTGRAYDMAFVHVFDWSDDGKLLSLREFNDTAEQTKAFD